LRSARRRGVRFSGPHVCGVTGFAATYVARWRAATPQSLILLASSRTRRPTCWRCGRRWDIRPGATRH
jgi:hypothetical protein